MGDDSGGGYERRGLAEILVAQGSATPAQIAEAGVLGRESPGKPLGELLLGLGHVTSGQLAAALAAQYGLPLRTLRESELDPTVIRLVPAELAFRYQLLPLRRDNGELLVALADPANLAALDDLRFVTGLRVEPVVADAEDVRRLVEDHYLHRVMGGSADDDDVQVMADDDEDLSDVQSMAREALVVRLVNMLLRQAVQDRASDIHLEPFERELIVRFRIDGVLRPMPSPSKRLQAAIISRVKIMAEMDIAERRLPQDGRIKVRVEGREIDLRISTVPTLYGESVVMRLLDRDAGLLSLAGLGFPETTRERFERLLKIPYGILLATGPTGSGKTTTLYAALQQVVSPTRKVITIEDPVEYQLDGVNQIAVRPKIGLSFAEGLRHILRQDPDVIMVGEIRDHETADIAIHAALTGHLVFSTLHTNDSAGAVARLLDMGIEPFLVASSLEGVLAQRLVRRLCPACKAPHAPTSAELYDMGNLADESRQHTIFRPVGCDECRGTGYRGRVGLIELLVVDDEIQELILRRASSAAIRESAQARGLVTLREEGWRHAFAGLTSIDEVTRVTHESESALGLEEYP
ncbi:MAG TPA: type II secretion system protein GspE [Armatimonadetes bacterium]|nr:type II secretion system protein GspE [Armatimonadota bacterium]